MDSGRDNMIDKKMLKALNEQVNAELYSYYLYLSMSAWFETLNLRGFAHWMRVQSREEMNHAMKIFDFVVERGGKVDLATVDKPTGTWTTPLAAFQAAYKHELLITASIYRLVDLAGSIKDHATASFLKWFVDEQVEEEANSDAVVQKLRMAADSMGALLIIDRELASRG
jgi:ferritin